MDVGLRVFLWGSSVFRSPSSCPMTPWLASLPVCLWIAPCSINFLFSLVRHVCSVCTVTVIVALGALSFLWQAAIWLTQRSEFQVKKEYYETKHGNANPDLRLQRKDIGNTCPVLWVCHSAGPSTEDLSYLPVSAPGQYSCIQREAGSLCTLSLKHWLLVTLAGCFAVSSWSAFWRGLREWLNLQTIASLRYLSSWLWSVSSTSVRAVALDEFMI